VVTTETPTPPSREALLHALYEAAELEHNLMCTYLYAAFSLRDGEAEGLSPVEAAAVARWRREILQIAIEEMGHLTAVWNISAALGGTPRFGRGNFPLDPGALPAGMVVKLVPFGQAVLQHFIHLERPEGSTEPEGAGFAPDWRFTRGIQAPRLTPMPLDYDTVGTFYATLGANLRAFVAHHGEAVAFAGDPALQLSPAEITLGGARPVICLKTALAAFTAIVEQGEGAPLHSTGSHYQRFLAIRDELAALEANNPSFAPALPVATNPVLRRPTRPEGRVWIEDEEAAATVDLANAGYALMLRLLAYSYTLPRPSPEKGLAVDLALGLMRAVTPLAERAARLPAGPSSPGYHAGMSFTALRDAAPFVPGPGARRFLRERFGELTNAAAALAKNGDERTVRAARIFADLAKRAERGFDVAAAAAPAPPAQTQAAPAAAPPTQAAPAPARKAAPGAPPTPTIIDGVEHVEGEKLTLLFEGKKCIHARHCVTGAPTVFLANVQGPWICPDTVEVERLVEVAHVCPSGAIRYRRKDGVHDEMPPPVNLVAVREAGPYAFRGDLRIDGVAGRYRATLCRCGASKNKPYCDGSHHDAGFAASGEPKAGKTDMLEVRDGPLAIDPETDGPLAVRGNLEITSGTGRVVARLQQARLCRCGGSNTKPFCDGTHARIGFKST
jgi:CDGSH-type Zn-finger protein/uncharacterized Fe-S cluster protein YjdI